MNGSKVGKVAMRGYFGIGVESLSKQGNAGNLFRTAQGFGAQFIFTIAANYDGRASDTSRSNEHLPLYEFDRAEDMLLPKDCRLVGIELLDEAVDLPTFKHPPKAAYVLGPERDSLSPGLVARCDHIIKIPTSFCLNVATAGAIVMYDRIASLGNFGQRSLSTQKEGLPPPPHIQGATKIRRK